ncbi:single-stranded DNA-binding protein [Brevibacillus borstelensis]|uniref:single-stranded DNA-binding protein n=1 Tax=Brevibacillus borstelensis TaxID=45462 RepID=UPI0004F3AAC3|nr:single-stranded DNA-binding protein [Brevibacillus borstelensis]KKX53270.1 single-stranded DNA-binding protein [Brevibacillus borstelensis cifa_chp40]
MNKVILIGNLTKDPELRYTPNGVAVTNFTLAINRPRYGEKQEADFINVVAWQKLADTAATYLRKGRQCAVEGRIQTRSYQDKDGKKRYVTEVLAEHIQFLGGKGGKDQDDSNSGGGADNSSNNDPFGDPFSGGQPINISDEDLPF